MMASLVRFRSVPARGALHRPHALALASALALLGASASAQTEQVTIVGRTPPAPASVAGFDDTPAARSPFQASSASQSALKDQGIDTLNDLTRIDASVGDAYNAPGYWASVRVRGYALDNRFNYRRDGLPISGETALPLFDKERVEVLKGTSGIQAGTSAPGGLVNLVVKRPRGSDSTTLSAGLSDGGSLLLSADLDRQLGDALGLRLNASTEQLHPLIHDAQGTRHGLAAAGSLKLRPDSLLEAEVEFSRQSQPSVPGFSMLGGVLPSARDIDPKTNLNNQPWSLPVVFAGTTASLRWTETLGADWQAVAQAMTQRLRTDDRLAFPYGCSAEGLWDRYCSDGSFDYYAFQSDHERRTSDALQLAFNGRLLGLGARHALSLGVLATRYRAELQDRVDDVTVVGIGQIDGAGAPITLPSLGRVPNTNRSERSTEFFVRDHASFGDGWGLWLGLRHSQIQRASVRTDGSRPTDYDQGFTTPWLAATWQLSPQDMVYASWGQGIESAVVPNKSAYGAQAGQALPAMRSRQAELGWKHEAAHWGASATVFDIDRPYLADSGSSLSVDGSAHHQGLELAADTRLGAWSLRGSAQWLDARREGAALASDNGRVPENVARRTLRAQLGWQPADVPGLALAALLSHEGPRYVLPDNSVALPSWTTVGLNARYSSRVQGRDWTWRAGVDNLFDRRAWQESPYQYGHIYLYPVAARAFRASVQVSL